jgi:type I restriction enzyme M protein
MFVQSSHFIEEQGERAAHRVTFYGQEYKSSNLRLAKMNLAVHALEGNLVEANTFYEDVHNLIGMCDFLMANPPFNVDKVDAQKVKNDPRLPFGLPGVNKDKNVSNGNYLWISYFWSYLKPTGRAGFVMSSQASSAGHGEMEVRRKLVETGDVDVMMSIRPNFFYTRTVPCELWHFDKGKPKERKEKVLMIDARNIFRKVNRKIYDFSPEQLKNLTSIVWLYRGQPERFISLVQEYLERTLKEAETIENKARAFCNDFNSLAQAQRSFLKSRPKDCPLKVLEKDRDDVAKTCFESLKVLSQRIAKEWNKHCQPKLPAQKKLLSGLDALATSCREAVKEVDFAFKLTIRLVASAEKDASAKEDAAWDGRAIGKLKKELEVHRQELVEQLKVTAYFERQAHWLLSRFPDGKLVDVAGLVKLTDRKEIAAADWSLTPGRYVGVAPAEVDEDFDFEQALSDIHTELQELNLEAQGLSSAITNNFEELGA